MVRDADDVVAEILGLGDNFFDLAHRIHRRILAVHVQLDPLFRRVVRAFRPFRLVHFFDDLRRKQFFMGVLVVRDGALNVHPRAILQPILEGIGVFPRKNLAGNRTGVIADCKLEQLFLVSEFPAFKVENLALVAVTVFIEG